MEQVISDSARCFNVVGGNLGAYSVVPGADVKPKAIVSMDHSSIPSVVSCGCNKAKFLKSVACVATEALVLLSISKKGLPKRVTDSISQKHFTWLTGVITLGVLFKIIVLNKCPHSFPPAAPRYLMNFSWSVNFDPSKTLKWALRRFGFGSNLSEGRDGEPGSGSNPASKEGPKIPVSESSAPEIPVSESSAPEIPVSESSAPESPVSESSAPESPVSESSAPESPVAANPAPEILVLDNSVPGSPVSGSPAPESPVAASPAPEIPVLDNSVPGSPVSGSPAPESPVAASPAPRSPVAASPAPRSPVAASPAPRSPVAASPAPRSPVAASPAPESPVNGNGDPRGPLDLIPYLPPLSLASLLRENSPDIPPESPPSSLLNAVKRVETASKVAALLLNRVSKVAFIVAERMFDDATRPPPPQPIEPTRKWFTSAALPQTSTGTTIISTSTITTASTVSGLLGQVTSLLPSMTFSPSIPSPTGWLTSNSTPATSVTTTSSTTYTRLAPPVAATPTSTSGTEATSRSYPIPAINYSTGERQVDIQQVNKAKKPDGK